jgi:hypothetical protein
MPNVQYSGDECTLIISVEGILTGDDVVQVIQHQYPSLGERCILWDLARADTSSQTKEDFVQIAAAVRQFHPRSGPRKTAYVVVTRSAYTMLFKYVSQAVSTHVAVEYNVFMNRDAAVEWLQKP